MHSTVCDEIRCLKRKKKKHASTINLLGVLSVIAQEYQYEFSVT